MTLDVAVSSDTTWRSHWTTLLGSLRSKSIDNMYHSVYSLMWLIRRGINVTRIRMKVNAWRVSGCDLSPLNTMDLLHFGLNSCSSVTDECILKA